MAPADPASAPAQPARAASAHAASAHPAPSHATPADPAPADAQVRAVRQFNRFYTQRIGVLSASLLGSRFSLAEGRVLYELAHHVRPTAAELARELALDQGYLSRILERFERARLLRRVRSASDGRKSHVDLTAAGRAALARLDRAACEDVSKILAPVPEAKRRRVLGAMHEIQSALAPAPAADPAGPAECTLREPRPGDLGWIVERHGAIYATDCGWDQRFEALVARVVAEFAERGDTARERCWIAERGDARIGSVLLVARTKTIAQLRLLLVEPTERGTGVGTRLVDACIDFARGAGYRKLVLWTEAGLDAARRVYERAGFRLDAESHEQRYGREFVSQTWELALEPGAGAGARADAAPRAD